MRRVFVRQDSYHDSVRLMEINAVLRRQASVRDVVVAMATPHNVQRLAELGWTEGVAGATPNDLLVALDVADDAAAAEVQRLLDELLKARRRAGADGSAERTPTAAGWSGALQVLPEANLALISLPGRYAALEARRALERGLSVLLFSDNVPLEDEVELKRLSTERGLLLMGPGCGTAILNGVPLCFANEVRRGPIGIVGAAGTGIQEVASLIDRAGEGLSQAIGTGGRDLRAEVGGRTMLQGIRALAADPETRVVVAISKPPDPRVAEAMLAALERCGKPAVVHFVGAAPRASTGAVRFAASLEDAALAAVALVRGTPFEPRPFSEDAAAIDRLVARECAGKSPGQRLLRGYFTGGTLCDEALFIATRDVPGIRSNIHPDPALRPADPFRSGGHAMIDLGDDVFTVGRPHPMIEPAVRTERIDAEAGERDIAVVLLDVVLGHGSHADPAGALLPALVRMRDEARRAGGSLTVVASVVGTDRDPQGLAAQRGKLEHEGFVVLPSNAQAARLAARIVAGLAEAAGRGAEQLVQLPASSGPARGRGRGRGRFGKTGASRPRRRPRRRPRGWSPSSGRLY